MKKKLWLLLLITALLTGCTNNNAHETTNVSSVEEAADETEAEVGGEDKEKTEEDIQEDVLPNVKAEDYLRADMYAGEPYAVVNDNVPFFTEEDIEGADVFETYSDFDSLGRCGVAYANICLELMPDEKREDISSVKPSGWKNNPYDFVDGGYIYNRCHLIGFQLAGENANEKNLITGTRYMNVQGMLPFENMIADYVKETENHVLYRVTPIYEKDNLVAEGVLMEAYSLEDTGDGIQFNIFCYNVQPGCTIDYATGDNWESGDDVAEIKDEEIQFESEEDVTYILNTNSKKFHLESCPNADDISTKNRREFTGNREELVNNGYSPCGNCNP